MDRIASKLVADSGPDRDNVTNLERDRNGRRHGGLLPDYVGF